MKKALIASATIAVVASLATSACSALPFIESTPTEPAIITTIFPTDPPPTATPVPEPIYLNLVWLQHQPLYPTDAQTGLITRPWVRTQATSAYYGLVAAAQRYPQIKFAASLSPVLIRQLDEIVDGARDTYWELSARPVPSLSTADKRFIVQRFFDNLSPAAIARFPRLKELADKRGGGESGFTEADLRDLQVLFNLAWFDADVLAQPPLADLAAKGRDFAEADKPAIFSKVAEVVRNLIPMQRALQDSGQIELITSPFANAVLPLLQQPDFGFAVDAAEQLSRTLPVFQRHFGTASRGLWPAGGAVSNEVMALVADAGFAWTASGEPVLAKSLGMEAFTRDDRGTVQQADALYRPYVIDQNGKRLLMLFTDAKLSALVGTDYATMDAEQAAEDFVDRVQRIRERLVAEDKHEPHLVTAVIDTDSAWLAFPDGGAAFRDALFRKLTDAANAGTIQTTTPSAFAQQFPNQQTLPALPPGTLAGLDFGAWAGDAEQKRAWDDLRRVRQMFDDYLKGDKPAEPVAVERAYDAMLLAEGADWFAWFGAPQSTEVDAFHDVGFRSLLRKVYDALGVPVPAFVDVPIVGAPVAAPEQLLQGVFTATVDGTIETGEWDLAGVVRGAQGSVGPVNALYLGVNSDTLFLRIDASGDWATVARANPDEPLRVGTYLAVPAAENTAPLSLLGPDEAQRTPLGLNASHLIEWTWASDGTSAATLYDANTAGAWDRAPISSTTRVTDAAAGAVLELSVPLAAFDGDLRSGSNVRLMVLVSQAGRVLGQFPINSIAQLSLPK